MRVVLHLTCRRSAWRCRSQHISLWPAYYQGLPVSPETLQHSSSTGRRTVCRRPYAAPGTARGAGTLQKSTPAVNWCYAILHSQLLTVNNIGCLRAKPRSNGWHSLQTPVIVGKVCWYQYRSLSFLHRLSRYDRCLLMKSRHFF